VKPVVAHDSARADLDRQSPKLERDAIKAADRLADPRNESDANLEKPTRTRQPPSISKCIGTPIRIRDGLKAKGLFCPD